MVVVFPTLFYSHRISTFKQIKDDLVKSIYEEKKKDPVGVIISNQGGWQSQSFSGSSDNIVVSTVKDAVSRYFSLNKIFKEDTAIDFKNLWFNINGKGNFNMSHIHFGCDLSGVLWIKTSKECGSIEFVSPNVYTQGSVIDLYSDEIKEKYNLYSGMWFTPEEGKIIMFPSSIPHQVHPNRSNEERISVSFNMRLL